jgi:hypothetical protein
VRARRGSFGPALRHRADAARHFFLETSIAHASTIQAGDLCNIACMATQGLHVCPQHAANISEKQLSD